MVWDKMRVTLVIFLMCITPFMGVADVASKGYVTEYVGQQVDTKVDTSADAKQVMAGEYTVSGSFTVTGAFKVPTPPLPNPDAD